MTYYFYNVPFLCVCCVHFYYFVHTLSALYVCYVSLTGSIEDRIVSITF